MPDIKKPNVNGFPSETTDQHRENTAAHAEIKAFNLKHSGVIQSLRNKESLHPSVMAQYEAERKALKIPHNIHPGLVPPQGAASNAAPAQTWDKAKMNVRQHGGENVMDYSKINPKPQPKSDAGAPVLDYGKMKTPPKPAERTFTYDSKGGVAETVHAGAPDYKGPAKPAAPAQPEKPKFGRIIQKTLSKSVSDLLDLCKSSSLQKSPGLKQGSKLGREVYDEKNWTGHKQNRTGSGNMVGTKNEQVYGGKVGHKTAKDTAVHQEKIDRAKNKKQPVNTQIPADLKAKYEAEANTKKSVEEDQIPGGLSDKKHDSEFDPKKVKEGQKVESEHTSNSGVGKEIAQDHLTEDPKYYDKLAVMEKAKKWVSSLAKRCWDGYEPTPGKEAYSEGSCQLEKELGRGEAEDAKKGAKEKRYQEYLKLKAQKPALPPKNPIQK
jgi:hypothetical protein